MKRFKTFMEYLEYLYPDKKTRNHLSSLELTEIWCDFILDTETKEIKL